MVLADFPITFPELMVLGFISLLLTFGQSYIAKICIRDHVANTMLPCKKRNENPESGGKEDEYREEASELLKEDKGGGGGEHRRLLWNEHRMLSAGGGKAKCHAVLTTHFYIN